MLDRTEIFRSAHSPFGRAWPNVIPSTLCEALSISRRPGSTKNPGDRSTGVSLLSSQ
nr:MAG TPA: hypothetical protein [Inoviridae sp.]